MRKGYVREDFGRLDVSKTGWQRYSHLDGDARAVFIKLMRRPRTAFLLALFLGGWGAHRFYLGHYWIGAGILGLSIISMFTAWMPLLIVTAVIILIEIGHIVRTTEQFNDSIEGALMLETYTQPLFKDQKS